MKKPLPHLFIVGVLIAGAVYYFNGPITPEHLQAFHTLTQEDPLFYDPAMEVDLLREALRDMQDIDRRVIEASKPYQTEEQATLYPEGWTLWPETFLAQLPVVHDATTAFLEDPSSEGAEKLIERYKDTTTAYQEEIEKDIQLLENILSLDDRLQDRSIFFLNSGTTAGIVLNDLKLIHANAQALVQEIANREQCLYEGVCIDTKPTPPPTPVTERMPFEPLPEEVLNIYHQEESFLGPYYAATSCFGLTQSGQVPEHAFYIVHQSDETFHDSFQVPILSNKMFYRDIASSTEDVVSIFARINIPINVQNSTHHYMCSHLGYISQIYTQLLSETAPNFVDNNETYRIATIPHILKLISFNTLNRIFVPEFTNQPNSAFGLTVIESGYSLLYGTYFSSVWRLSTQPQYLSDDLFNQGLRGGYFTFDDMLHKGFGVQDLIDISKDHPDQSTLFSF
jgi:hypothetical protein